MSINYYFNKIFFIYNTKYFFILKFFNIINFFFYVYKKCEFFRFFKNFNFNIININRIYSTRLFFNGIGYKILKNKKKKIYKNFFKIDLGFSVKIYIKIKNFIKIKTYKNKIFILSFNKFIINKFIKFIYNLRKPDIYKGKGVRFLTKEFKFKKGKQRLLLIFLKKK